MIENRETLEKHEIKVESNTEIPEIPSVDADKNNGLAQIAIGGLIGAAMGTLAVVLTDKKTANTVNQVAKEISDAVKGATEGVNGTIKNGVETVKHKVSSLNNSNGTNSKQKVENETENVSTSAKDLVEEVKKGEAAHSSDSQAEKISDVQVFQLYEERLIANKKKVKTGEVAIAKHTETHIAQVSIPLEKERLVLEQIPVENETSVAPGEADFNKRELARIELYEQRAEVEKKAFVREQVRVCKEVEYKALELEDVLRREELDLDIQEGSDNNDIPMRTKDRDKNSQLVTQVERTDLPLERVEGNI